MWEGAGIEWAERALFPSLHALRSLTAVHPHTPPPPLQKTEPGLPAPITSTTPPSRPLPRSSPSVPKPATPRCTLGN
eukprot:3934372-Rhodomonas_salina.5